MTQAHSDGGPWARIRAAMQSERPTRTGVLIVAIWTGALLLPFVTKAYHLDDPFYIWVAQHILEDPLDFYGFELNWNGTPEPVADINKNPPLVSYYAAAVGGLAGWSELSLHLGFFLPALAAALGTYWLASMLCPRPLLAALIAAAMPVFAISASNVMAEVTMLAFYVWASYFWLKGLENGKFHFLLAGAVLAALATLTKYFGISAFPLFIAIAALKLRRPGVWLLALAAGFGIVAFYEWYTWRLYGEGHIAAAVLFANETRDSSVLPRSPIERLVIGLSFTGGCAAGALAYAAFVNSWKESAAWAVAAAGLAGAMWWLNRDLFVISSDVDEISPWIAVQLAVLMWGGLIIGWLTIRDVWRNRSTAAVYVFLLTAGAFAFAVYFNWTVNGRSLIAIAPAAAILITRSIFILPDRSEFAAGWRHGLPLIPLAMLSSALIYADTRLANAARDTARHFDALLQDEPGTVWYQGHWGLQYYLDFYGAEHWDANNPWVEAGDTMIVNATNTLTYPIDRRIISTVTIFETETCTWLATWNPAVGAGFYSDAFGILPFVFAKVPPFSTYAFKINFTGELELDFGAQGPPEDK